MKIRTALLLTMFLFGLILLTTAVFLVITYRQLDWLNQQEEVARNIERTTRELSYLSNDYLLHREREGLARWQAKFGMLSENIAYLNVNDPEMLVLVDSLKANQARLEAVHVDVMRAIAANAQTGESLGLDFIQVAWSRLEVQNQSIIFTASLLSQKIQDQEDHVRQTSLMLIYAMAGIFALYLLVNYFIIYRRMLRSLETLQTGTQIIGSGHLEFSIENPGGDEIGELARAFNQMTTSLREITASKADLEREINERRQAEHALLKSETQLRRLVEANLIGVISRNAYGQVMNANEAFLTMLGYTEEDLWSDGLNILDLVPDEDRSAEKQWMEAMSGSDAGKPREKVYLHKDGRRVPVLVGETRLEDEPTEYIGFVLDLTELKQAQAALAEYAEKLKRSNLELEQFAFIASHDLQEPLRKVRSFGDRLVRSLGDGLPPESSEYVIRMQNATERMQSMIDDLLELSRVGRRGEKFEQVQLSELAADALSDLGPSIHAARGQVVIGDLPEIEADPLQMRRLFQNLIGNAIKYHKVGVPPVVQVWGGIDNQSPAGKPQVTICVEDNGIGFNEEYLDRIFQPFTRLHGRSEYEGTGMGLAICKKIVERHQGSITARSQPGEGSTFLVTLPVQHER